MGSSLRGAVAVAMAVGLLAPLPARAEIVAAAERGPGIAFALRVERAGASPEWRVVHAPDGATFADVEVGDRWVLDLAVLDDGSLLLATAEPRESLVRVTRALGDARSETAVAGSSGLSDALFVSDGGRRLVLVNAQSAWLSADDGRTFARIADLSEDATWFAAAAARLAGSSVDLLLPLYDPDATHDVLAGAHRIRVGPGGRVRRRAISLGSAGSVTSIELGHSGVVYTAARARGGCALRTGARGSVVRFAREQQLGCMLVVGRSARRTIAVLGDTVLRLRGPSAVAVGIVSSAVHDVAPDGRGRALVLTTAPSLVRYERGRPPALLWAP